jgi:hypothetical protein
MEASNGRVRGKLAFYVNADALIEWADALERFPQHAQSVFLWEVGSERAEDRFAFYFRLRLFTVDSLGHCVIQLRFNNNAELPDREISEFCIRSEAAQLNRLGRLCREFAKLNDQVLEWSLNEGQLYRSIEDAEPAAAGDAKGRRT